MGKNIIIPAILSIFVFTILIGSSMGSAEAAVDMFLKIDGIDGESKDKQHTNEIDVLSWSWGVSQTSTSGSTGGTSAGKASAQDFSITKTVDKSTPKLYLSVFDGRHIPEVKFTVRSPGEKPLEFLIITLTDVTITSVQTGGSGGEDRPTESVSLNFAKVKIEYTEQKEDGTAGGKTEMTWNLEENTST